MIFIGIAVLIFILDWHIKKQAESCLKDDTVREIAGDRILLRKLHNRGVALGMLDNRPGIVLGTTAAVIAVMSGFFVRLLGMKGQSLQKLGCALMLGGGLNNLADRKQNGYVRDYFSFNVKWEKIRRLVFNLSDMFIFLGSALMILGGSGKKNP